jgi:NAD(P)-dependent dehydrogenase (short-subunit alcohol dehydrogenase family)
MNRFHEQRVAIVGASSGIGLAMARLAAQEGADIAMLSRTEAKLRTAAEGLSGKVRIRAMNMLDRADVAAAAEWLGPSDHIVMTAVADEVASRNAIDALSTEQIERSFDKLRGYANFVSATAKQLSPSGSLTLLSGVSALKPPPGFSMLAAAAASIVGFAKALARELAPVRVNVVMPGLVDTPIHQATREETRTWAHSNLPVRYFAQPGDIAEAIAGVATNRYITGHVLVVDGGLSQM